MKKFYTLVSTKKTDDGYAIQLDGKTVKTPSGQELTAPSKALADAVVAEWAAQGETVDANTMQLTALLNTAIDRARDRETITKSLLKYLDTDLLCYRVKEPEVLAAREKETWDKWLGWFDEHFEVPLDTTFGLDAIKQDEEAHSRVWNYIEGLDEYYFAILHVVTAQAGSIVLALAFIENAITADELFEAHWLEETYHAELANEAEYGDDPVIAKKQAAMRVELAAAQAFLDHLNDE